MTTAPASHATSFTPDDLECMPDAVRYELIDGELVERNSSAYSAAVGGRLIRRLGDCVEPEALGVVGPSDFGLQIFPDEPTRVAFPDGCYVAAAKLPDGLPARGWCRVAPDLVFEVVSPNDRAEDVEAKVRDYLAAGVSLLWVIYPGTRSVTVRHRDGTAISLTGDAQLTGEDVLPGFAVTVSDLFPAVAPPATRRKARKP